MTKMLRKRVIYCLLVLLPLVVLLPGCGGTSDHRVAITIGELTDLTGPASPAIIPLHWALQDMVRYYNEEELIPGVRFRMVSWDTRYDVSRDIPGYDWVRGRGAKLIVAVPPPTPVTLKPFADRDKFPICSLSTTEAMMDPPGWIFCFSNSHYRMMKTFLKWIHDVDWDYPDGKIPKIGLVGWDEAAIHDDDRALKEYASAHPDHIEYVGARIKPFGSIGWIAEVEALKNCDYIEAKGFPMGAFIKEFQSKGYKTRFFDVGTASSYRGFLVDQLGWAALDGVLTPNMSLMWNEDVPVVNFAKTLLYRYHSKAEAEKAIYAGLAYVGGVKNLVGVFEIIEAAIKTVGAENFSPKAFYDEAVKYKTKSPLWQGQPEWSFSETKRYLADHIATYKFDASAKDLVWVGGWVPLVLE
ncbi:MAG: hypothetical protein FJ012_01725 [Chloroflexi bacterium]|nr:hypothetical protein [Chloroflexota bacterium]